MYVVDQNLDNIDECVDIDVLLQGIPRNDQYFIVSGSLFHSILL